MKFCTVCQAAMYNDGGCFARDCPHEQPLLTKEEYEAIDAAAKIAILSGQHEQRPNLIDLANALRKLEGRFDDSHKGFSRRQLQEAFEWVANPNDWKAPIDAFVPEHKVHVVRAAIEFFTATEVEIHEFMDIPSRHNVWKDWKRVRSKGYRYGPAGP